MANFGDRMLFHLKDPHLLGTVAALALATAAYCKWTQERQEKIFLAQFECQSIEVPVSFSICFSGSEQDFRGDLFVCP